MKKSGVEQLAQHPGWRTRKPKKPDVVVFIEGGLVSAVIDLNARKPQNGIEYTVVDYDVLETEGPDYVKEYFEGRGKKLIAYMKKHLPYEYNKFQQAMQDTPSTTIAVEIKTKVLPRWV